MEPTGNKFDNDECPPHRPWSAFATIQKDDSSSNNDDSDAILSHGTWSRTSTVSFMEDHADDDEVWHNNVIDTTDRNMIGMQTDPPEVTSMNDPFSLIPQNYQDPPEVTSMDDPFLLIPQSIALFYDDSTNIAHTSNNNNSWDLSDQMLPIVSITSSYEMEGTNDSIFYDDQYSFAHDAEDEDQKPPLRMYDSTRNEEWGTETPSRIREYEMVDVDSDPLPYNNNQEQQQEQYQDSMVVRMEELETHPSIVQENHPAIDNTIQIDTTLTSFPVEVGSSGDDIDIVVEGNYTDNDVLFGRGGHTLHHAGNKRFLRVRTNLYRQYQFAKTNKEKKELIYRLIQSVYDSGGRFMAKRTHKTTEVIYLVHIRNRQRIYRKASQAMREGQLS